MTAKNDGGPAFPEIRIRGGDNYNQPMKLYYGGMTLRDYFAAKAMHAVWDDIPDDVDRDFALASLGRLAYEMADAMLKARETA